MSDDDWETAEVVVPKVVVPGTAAAAAVPNKWEEEEAAAPSGGAGGSDDARSKEELIAALNKLEREFASYRKSKEAPKKKKTQEEKLLDALLPEEERKRREKEQAEAEQMERVNELFGENAGSGSVAAAAAAAAPVEKKEVLDLPQLIADHYTRTFPGKEHAVQVEQLVNKLTSGLTADKLKALGERLVSVANEKRKQQLEAEKKKKQEAARKPVDARGGKKVSGKMDLSDLGDYLDDDADYDEEDDVDGDFM